MHRLAGLSSALTSAGTLCACFFFDLGVYYRVWLLVACLACLLGATVSGDSPGCEAEVFQLRLAAGTTVPAATSTSAATTSLG